MQIDNLKIRLIARNIIILVPFSIVCRSQDLGCIQTTILFQPWENRINATVEQAKGLRPNRLTGTVGKYHVKIRYFFKRK